MRRACQTKNDQMRFRTLRIQSLILERFSVFQVTSPGLHRLHFLIFGVGGWLGRSTQKGKQHVCIIQVWGCEFKVSRINICLMYLPSVSPNAEHPLYRSVFFHLPAPSWTTNTITDDICFMTYKNTVIYYYRYDILIDVYITKSSEVFSPLPLSV